MKQLSKKDHSKKKPTDDEGHWEGKYWCNCRIRNYRLWLGKKKYGSEFSELLPYRLEALAEEDEGVEPDPEAKSTFEVDDA